jgi:hypothetical protein
VDYKLVISTIAEVDCQAAMIEDYLDNYKDQLSPRQVKNYSNIVQVMLKTRDCLSILKEENFALKVNIMRNKEHYDKVQHTIDGLLGISQLQ